MPPRGKQTKQQAPTTQQRRQKTQSTIDTVTDTNIAETTDPTISLCQTDHDKQHLSDEDNNTSDDECKKENMHSHHERHVLEPHSDISNNVTSGENSTSHGLGVIADYISFTDKQNSILLLTTETAPLTLYIPKLFRCKKFITNNEELCWKGKTAHFFYEKYNVPENLQQE